MNNRITWPPLRTDIVGVLCLAIAIACFVFGRWPFFAGGALVGAIFCAVSPRMKGPFGFSAGSGTRIGGEFEDPDPRRGQLHLEGAEEPPLELPHPPQEQPSKGPGED